MAEFNGQIIPEDVGKEWRSNDSVKNANRLIMDQYISLVEACARGDETFVRSVLEEVTEDVRMMLLGKVHTKVFNERDKYQGSILQHAVCGGNLKLLQYLASHPCTNLEEVTFPIFNTTNSTSLTQACRDCNLEAAKILLESGCDPNHGYESSTPLSVAVRAETNEVVELLLKYGADPFHHPCCETSSTFSLPFYIACLQGNLDIVNTLEAHLCDGLLSSEQLVLCYSLLGLHLINKRINIPAGISFWHMAIDQFMEIAATQGHHMAPAELSNLLYSLYVTESCLVQTGQKLKLGKEVLVRSHACFPDFKLCVRKEDISSAAARIHSVLIRSCISTSICQDLTLYDLLLDIKESSMPKEDKKLCLLLILENGLLLEQGKVLVHSTTMNELLSLVIEMRLYTGSPGCIVLLHVSDIVNCVIEQVLNCREQMSEGQNEKIGKFFMRTGEVVAKLAYLILRGEMDGTQSSYLAEVVKKYVVLAQKAKNVYPLCSMECQLMTTTVSFLLSIPDDFREFQNDSNFEKTCLTLLQSLLRCGIDPNSRDAEGNSIMFDALKLNEPYRSDIIELLMAYGGHVDVTNYAGNSAYQILLTLPDNRVDPLLCRTLKCRAASAVSFFKIPFKNHVPTEMENFIALHEIHTGTQTKNGGSKKSRNGCGMS